MQLFNFHCRPTLLETCQKILFFIRMEVSQHWVNILEISLREFSVKRKLSEFYMKNNINTIIC